MYDERAADAVLLDENLWRLIDLRFPVQFHYQKRCF